MNDQAHTMPMHETRGTERDNPGSVSGLPSGGGSDGAKATRGDGRGRARVAPNRLTRDEEIAIHASGDVDMLAESHVDLARTLARKYAKGNDTLCADLTQEACLGLLIAARKWDPKFGVRFATYARYWATRLISECCRKHRRMVALPHSQAGVGAAAIMARREVESPEHLASELGVKIGTAWPLFALLSSVEKNDERYDEKGQAYEWLTSDDDPERDVIEARQRAAIRHVVATGGFLTEVERLVISLRFFGPEMLTLRQVGELLPRGISKQRVDQIENCALRKLAGPMAKVA